jgi:Pyridoxamine 5'-phosphate oxidase
VATWGEFEKAEPEFAARLKKLMTTRKHLTMATLRRDGSPRISGTEVQFSKGQLQIGSMPRAVKAMDLLRDPRVAIHGPTHDPSQAGRWRGEAKIAGRAIAIPNKSAGHFFRIDIGEAVITRLNSTHNGLVIESWEPGRGYRELNRLDE